MKENLTEKLKQANSKFTEHFGVVKSAADKKWHGFDNSKKIVTVIITVVVIWMFTGIFHFGSKKEAASVAASAVVKTEISNSTTKSRYIKLNGVTYADQIVNLKSEVEGLIVEIPSKRSRYVKKGETLIIVDQKNRIKAVEQAEAELNSEKVNYNSTKALYDKQLSSQFALKSAKAKLLAAEANLQAALDNLEKTFIKAPFDGFLNSINADVGEFVTTVNGIGVGSIAILDPLDVVLYIPEKDISYAQSAKTAEVIFGENIIEGNVTSLAKVAEPETRSFKMEIKVPNKDLLLNAGQSVVARVKVEDIKAHLLPKSVINLDIKGNIIIKAVNENSEVQEYKAEIIDEDDSGFWLAGLPDTLNIITLGHQYVNSGEKVEVGK